MRRFLLLACTAGLVLAGSPTGIPPRGSAAEYPAHETAPGVTLAAGRISPKQVRQRISAEDLSSLGYIVVEVAVYPEPNQEITLSQDDFLLDAGPNTPSLRPATSRAIAFTLYPTDNRNSPLSGVTPHGDVTIGRETSTDPVTGRRQSTVFTGVAAGVDNSDAPPPPDPAATDRARALVEQELGGKSLPEGKIAQPVAGYLYFAKPKGKTKKPTYELSYYGGARRITLRLPDTP